MSIDDTGPPYPRLSKPGANAIGSFAIGVSVIGSIGDLPAFDPWTTVMSQYANSPVITALITDFAGWVDPTINLENFFDLIWNVNTAVGYGLDVWGRIVGVNRILTVQTPGAYFGFQETGEASGFGQASFYAGAPLTSNYVLSDEAYRTLILTKAFANITGCSMQVLNQMLLSLFPNRGNCYVTEGVAQGPWFGFQESTDGLGFGLASFYSGEILNRMAMTYTFDFALSPVELAIVKNSGVLPRPTGVKAQVVINI